MRIELFGGLKAWVTWKHEQFQNHKILEGDYNHLPIRGTTTCIVKIESEPQNEVFGNAACSINDQFCKETGRRISLGRALDKLNVSKSEKRKIFNQYENR